MCYSPVLLVPQALAIHWLTSFPHGHRRDCFLLCKVGCRDSSTLMVASYFLWPSVALEGLTVELWIQASIPAILRAGGVVRITEWGPLHAGFKALFSILYPYLVPWLVRMYFLTKDMGILSITYLCIREMVCPNPSSCLYKSKSPISLVSPLRLTGRGKYPYRISNGENPSPA